MESITFRGAFIRNYDGRHDEGGVFHRINFTAAWSDTVAAQMDWQPTIDGVSQGKLIGRLNASHFILTPNGGKDLKSHELQLNIQQVDDFEFFTIKNKDGDSTRMELRFQALSRDPNIAKIVAYLQAIGRSEAQLKISYVKQEDLPLEVAETPAPAAGKKPRGKGASA